MKSVADNSWQIDVFKEGDLVDGLLVGLRRELGWRHGAESQVLENTCQVGSELLFDELGVNLRVKVFDVKQVDMSFGGLRGRNWSHGGLQKTIGGCQWHGPPRCGQGLVRGAAAHSGLWRDGLLLLLLINLSIRLVDTVHFDDIFPVVAGRRCRIFLAVRSVCHFLEVHTGA